MQFLNLNSNQLIKSTHFIMLQITLYIILDSDHIFFFFRSY